MQLLEVVQQELWLGLSLVFLLGLLVGSFLNVVIHRLPLMMERAWRRESTAFLSEQSDIGTDNMAEVNAIVDQDQTITLSKPASRCPNCQHQIRWYENIPVISWLLLRGKCSNCKTAISIRYPVVELITALASALVFWKFGATLEAVFALGLTWSLIALTGIDFDTQLLPDRITLPLAGFGLAANALGLFQHVTLSQSVWGFLIGFLCLWIVNKLYFIVTLIFRGQGQDGMGYGDFKLLAALGAWMGWSILPLIILLSSLVGSVIGLVLLRRNNGESKPFAFGPYIAIAGFIALIWGNDIIRWYLGMYA